MTDLTPEAASHDAMFSPDHSYLIDDFSRVDLPPVVVLRKVSDGAIAAKLEEADIKELEKLGWNMPEVFTAKGRDGTTDIWGIIYQPANFNPGITYPVLESIYAGPHNSFLPQAIPGKD